MPVLHARAASLQDDRLFLTEQQWLRPTCKFDYKKPRGGVAAIGANPCRGLVHGSGHYSAKWRKQRPCILPAVSGTPRSASAQTETAVAVQPLRVLLADDDRDGASTLSTLLELEGYEVRTVHGGQEALDTAREFKPDVCLLDIGMPKITGYDAARRLRQRYGDDCPVLIAVTGWKQASDKILATLAGFDHHVAKPYEPSQLLNLLATLRPGAR